MISSSITLVDRKEAKNTGDNASYQITSQGCSEFPAHYPNIDSYVSLNVLMRTDRDVLPIAKKALGPNYTALQYSQDWTNFVLELFKDINERSSVPLFEPYTAKNLKEDFARKTMPLRDSSGIFGPYDFAKKDPDDTLLGIKTNCTLIRKMSEVDYYNSETQRIEKTKPGNLCRKTQLAHTVLRLGWSSGVLTAVSTLNIWKRNLGIHPLYCLWAGYKLRWATHRAYSDYGDAFIMDADFISPDAFVANFFNKAIANRVMAHFMPVENPILNELGSIVGNGTKLDNFFAKLVMGKQVKTMERYDSFINADILKFGEEDAKRLLEVIAKEEAMLGKGIQKCKFSFRKKLFKSVVTGEPYDAWIKPESRLNRLIFQDEEGTYLSVLKGSKCILVEE